MTAPKGYSSQEKDERLLSQFTTVEPVRTLQNALSVLSHEFVYQVGTDAAEAGSTSSVIVATGHAALKGDVILLTSGTHSGKEIKVWEVSTNSITLAETLPSAVVAAVTFSILRHKYPVVESTGEVKVTGVFTEVATAADGGALPALTKVVSGYDGTNVQVLKTDAAGELQVDVLSSALPSGAATSAAQTDGTQKTQIVDGSGNVIGSTGNALDVNLKTPVVVDVSLSQANDSVAVFGSDGAVNRALKTDASGELQIDVLSSALPSGAATETTLNAVKTSVEIIDNAISGNEMQVDVKLIEGVIDANNTTSTPLGAGGNFTGAWTEIKDYNSINLGVFSDVASATDGLRIEYSFNGVSVHHFHLWTFAGGANGVAYQLAAEFRYFRVNYTNGATPQASFLLQSNLKPTALFPSSYRASQTFTSQSQVILTKGIIVGETTGGGGGYVAVKVNPSGALVADVTGSVTVSGTVAATQSGTWNINNISGTVSLPTGAATESTLSTLNTKVPSQGQAAMAASLPVVIASNQTAIPASQSGTWNINNISGTVSLPTGAATESTLSSINTKTPSLGQANMAGSQPVVIASNQSNVPVSQAGRSIVTRARNVYSSTNVTTGAYVQLVASLGSAVNEVEIFDSSGETLVLATGGAGSEVDQAFVFPGGNGRIPLAIAASTRVSIKAVSATANAGEIAINFYS